jgi:hypothetical protein
MGRGGLRNLRPVRRARWGKMLQVGPVSWAARPDGVRAELTRTSVVTGKKGLDRLAASRNKTPPGSRRAGGCTSCAIGYGLFLRLRHRWLAVPGRGSRQL